MNAAVIGLAIFGGLVMACLGLVVLCLALKWMYVAFHNSFDVFEALQEWKKKHPDKYAARLKRNK